MPRDRTAELLEAAKINGSHPTPHVNKGFSSANSMPSPGQHPRRASAYTSLQNPHTSPDLSGHVTSSPSLSSRRPSAPSPSTSSSAQGNPHSFVVHTYKAMKDCRLCGKMLLGFRSQGYKCIDCNFDCHEKCRSAADREMPCGSMGKGEAEHDFAPKTFLRPTDCMICMKLLVGFSKQGLECRGCALVVHEKCIMNAKACKGAPVVSSRSMALAKNVARGPSKEINVTVTPDERQEKEDPCDGLWEEVATEAMATATELKEILEQSVPVVDHLWSLYDQDIKEFLPDKKRQLRHQIQEIVYSLNDIQTTAVKGMDSLKPNREEPVYLQRIKRLHYESVNNQFKALVKRLSDMEDKYMKATDSRTTRLKEIFQDTGDDTLVFCMLNTDVFVQEYQEIQERNEELKHLMKGMEEIRQLQIMMACLVDGQQEAIDRIENNTAATAAKVEAVIQSLKDTRQLQSGARQKKMIFGGIVGTAAVGGAASVVL